MATHQYLASDPSLLDGELVIARVDSTGKTLISGTISLPPSGSAGSPLTDTLVSPTAKAVPTASSEAITGSPLAPITGVLVQAPLSNTVSVFVGAPGITTSTGIELAPGSSLMVRINRTDLVHCISGSAAQTLRILVM